MTVAVGAGGGRAASVSGVDPERVVAAVRDPDDGRVDCPPPGPVHEYVGYPAGGRRLERRTAMAAVARSRGATAPQDDAIEAARQELATLEVPEVALRAARRRLATAGEECDRLAESVARLQGRVQALREVDADASEVEAELREATRRLSEAETERAAAEQALSRARERAREARDARERRLRLRDRLHNRRREAREHLADRVRPDADAAVAAAGWTDATELADADDRTAALALARVADLSAPVVTTPGPFDDAERAHGWLDAPVVHVYQ
jgi:chromosome segregation ATPase